jgi:hypothetical protein
MKKEHPKPFLVRLYKKHRVIIKKMRKGTKGKDDCDAAAIRYALEFFASIQSL